MICEKEEPDLQTPMMRQYFSMKKKYAQEILFFRMGDFYEMFFDDARVASEILGIALTSRSKEKNAIPMAGVPVRAIDSYLSRLLKAGKRVAICEQIQDPRDATGLVDREVVRVISPGTVTDEKIVGERSNNFICSVVVLPEQLGLAWLDVTTGQFLVWEARNAAEISAQLSRIDPAESLLPEQISFTLDRHPELERALAGVVKTPYPDPFFDRPTAYRSLTEHFGTRTLEGFGCDHMGPAICAGGGLIRYVQETQKASLRHITKVAAFRASRYIPIDRPTRRALELTETQRGEHGEGTLLAVIDETATSVGARMLHEWLLNPLQEVAAIHERQEAVAELLEKDDQRDRLSGMLRQVHDLERISTRLSYRSANARDLVALRRTLEVIPVIREQVASSGCELLRAAAADMDVPMGLQEAIASAIVDLPPLSVKDGGLILPGFDAELDELRDCATQGTRWIARFQEEEIQRTGIGSLKVGYNKVFGYYIEITNTHRERIPEHYIRKQTLKNCERFITPDLKEHEAKVLNAKERVMALEHDLFVRLRDQAAEHIPQFQTAAAALAQVDIIAALAGIARKRGYIRPLVNDSMRLRIEDGRHPVVESCAGKEGFVPNSVDLDVGRGIMIITGPNMAGKSTYIRQVAVLTLLAQMGSFIPARKAEIGVVDRIFTRVGASDDLARGQSTFMVEMNETANILNNATPRSLIILDEVGRGTSTFDGVSLAWAITEHVAQVLGARTLFATHYHELTALAASLKNVLNYNFAVKEWNDDIIFLRKIVEGGTDKSYGIHVARLAGIPRPVLDRAREILSNLESQSLDLDGQPAIAAHSGAGPAKDAGSGNTPRQLDLFHDANEGLLKELKRLETDRMTPLEALEYLAQVKKRIV